MTEQGKRLGKNDFELVHPLRAKLQTPGSTRQGVYHPLLQKIRARLQLRQLHFTLNGMYVYEVLTISGFDHSSEVN